MFANDGHEPEWINGKLHIGSNEVNDIEEYSASTGTTKKAEPMTGSSAQEKKDESVSKQLGNFLSAGGDIIKKGFAMVGRTIGEGIRSSKFLQILAILTNF